MAFELDRGYLAASAFRFMDNASDSELKSVYADIVSGNAVDLKRFRMELPLTTAAE